MLMKCREAYIDATVYVRITRRRQVTPVPYLFCARAMSRGDSKEGWAGLCWTSVAVGGAVGSVAALAAVRLWRTYSASSNKGI